MTDLQTLKEENEILRELVMRYRSANRIPLCEICGELIKSDETRFIICEMESRKQGYKKQVLQHLHLGCWHDILGDFKYNIKKKQKKMTYSHTRKGRVS